MSMCESEAAFTRNRVSVMNAKAGKAPLKAGQIPLIPHTLPPLYTPLSAYHVVPPAQVTRYIIGSTHNLGLVRRRSACS